MLRTRRLRFILWNWFKLLCNLSLQRVLDIHHFDNSHFSYTTLLHCCLNHDMSLETTYTGVSVSEFGYQSTSVSKQRWGLVANKLLDKICLDSESLKSGSRYPNLDKSYQILDIKVLRYPNRGRGL